MIDRANRQIITTAARAAGVPADRIAAAIAELEGREARGVKEEPLLLNQAGVARLLSISRWSVGRLVKTGKLNPRRILGVRRFRRGDVLALVAHGDEDCHGVSKERKEMV